jgi:NADH-quinone oxidoreductase subunit E
MDSSSPALDDKPRGRKKKFALVATESHEFLHQPPLNDPNIKQEIDQILEANKGVPGSTMIILNEIQSRVGYISQPVQEYVAWQLNVAPAAIHGVVTFYSFFTTQPRGRHTVKFCMGTACYVGGTPMLIQKAKQIFDIEPGQTTPDQNVSLEVCRCVGACSQAPVVVVDEQTFGRNRPSRFAQLINKLIKPQE